MKIILQRLVLLAALLGATVASPLQARPFDLSDNTWSNPEFVKWFTGTYAFNGQINPQINSSEQALFQQIAPTMAIDSAAAVVAIQQYIVEFRRQNPTGEYSAALDYTMGSLYLQTGDIAQAIRLYQTSIERFPTFQRAYQNLGLALVQAERYAEALPPLMRAVELGGGSGILWGLVGFAYLNTGRSTQSLAAYEQALLFQPDSRDWRLGKLNALLNTGNRTTAIAMLNEMIAEQPDSATFWMQQANAFLGNGDPLEAAINLEWVARSGMATPSSLLLLGDIYLNEGLPSLAVAAYQQALETSEVGTDRMLRIVENLIQRGAASQATSLLTEVKALSGESMSDPETLKVLNIEAQLALQTGDTSGAAAILEQILARDPLNGAALLGLAEYYRDSGQTERAVLQFERATRVESVRVRAWIGLGRLYVAQRDYRKALNALYEAQALEPKSYLAEYIDQLERIVRRG